MRGLACEATCAVYRAFLQILKDGMSRSVSELVVAGYTKMHLVAMRSFSSAPPLPAGLGSKQREH